MLTRLSVESILFPAFGKKSFLILDRLLGECDVVSVSVWPVTLTFPQIGTVVVDGS